MKSLGIEEGLQNLPVLPRTVHAIAVTHWALTKSINKFD